MPQDLIWTELQYSLVCYKYYKEDDEKNDSNGLAQDFATG